MHRQRSSRKHRAAQNTSEKWMIYWSDSTSGQVNSKEKRVTAKHLFSELSKPRSRWQGSNQSCVTKYPKAISSKLTPLFGLHKTHSADSHFARDIWGDGVSATCLSGDFRALTLKTFRINSLDEFITQYFNFKKIKINTGDTLKSYKMLRWFIKNHTPKNKMLVKPTLRHITSLDSPKT